MKPRIGVYLSKRTAARLTSAAKRRGASKSALVEAALNRFLDADTGDSVALTDRLAELSGQVGQLDRDLGIVSEIVALHARFHLAVTPELPPPTQHTACKRGSARFDEFAAQIERRIQEGTSLMQETIDRLGATAPAVSEGDRGEGGPSAMKPTAYDLNCNAPSHLDEMKDTAAVREDGSTSNFRVPRTSPLH